MNLDAKDIALVAAGAGASALAGIRWLRVAQREHYLPGSVLRFAGRWWFVWFPPNRLLAAAAIAGAAAAPFQPAAGLVACGAVAVGPFKLALKGRAPGPMGWTRRMKTLAGTWVVIHGGLVVFGLATGAPASTAVVGALLTPLLVDAAVKLTQPIEARLAKRFVDQAAKKLGSIRPTTIAITGSYGKTSTKGYVAHLVAGSKTVLATPKSFNNSAGLARSVNEHLAPGTDVFVAEMGTYGKGEIADLCSWVKPEVAMITAIGPVHLERFKSEANIVEAKFEIFGEATTCILNVDSEWLRPIADRLEAAGRQVLRCSGSDPSADVAAVRDGGGTLVVHVNGNEIGRAPLPDAQPSNVACAVAAALAVGVPVDVIGRRLDGLPGSDFRLAVTTGSSGATIVDDTYNSNPAGARAALRTLLRSSSNDGRTVVVTPGMIELGRSQKAENESLAREVATAVSHLLVVGWTNRPALLRGAAGGTAEVLTFETRDDAVAWVKANLGPGDAALYENDLPDHFA